jgi:hypothetical protein
LSGPGQSTQVCPSCGFVGPPVQVHGHGECTRCHTNIEPCCNGADAAGEAGATPDIDTAPDPQLFVQLFEHLGGRKATVTTDALLFALTQRLGTDLDDARLVLEAAERAGLVRAERAGCHRLRAAGKR